MNFIKLFSVLNFNNQKILPCFLQMDKYEYNYVSKDIILGEGSEYTE